jgi:hypothetical protein
MRRRKKTEKNLQAPIFIIAFLKIWRGQKNIFAAAVYKSSNIVYEAKKAKEEG